MHKYKELYIYPQSDTFYHFICYNQQNTSYREFIVFMLLYSIKIILNFKLCDRQCKWAYGIRYHSFYKERHKRRKVVPIWLSWFNNIWRIDRYTTREWYLCYKAQRFQMNLFCKQMRIKLELKCVRCMTSEH